MLTATVSEKDEELVINLLMNGELLYAYNAMTGLTEEVVDSARKKSGKCTR